MVCDHITCDFFRPENPLAVIFENCWLPPKIFQMLKQMGSNAPIYCLFRLLNQLLFQGFSTILFWSKTKAFKIVNIFLITMS